jgi:uncharacterized membrane protein
MIEKTKKRPGLRVAALDMLRGFSVLSMAAYHTLYDLVYLFGWRLPWYTGRPGYLWQQSICWAFILVAGASLRHSRRWARHGWTVFGCALVLTLVTFLVMPEMLVSFGVLHMLGLCMLLAAGIRPLPEKVPPVLGFAVCAALFVLLKGLPEGFVGLLDWPLIRLPGAWYGTPVLFWLGLPGAGFFSSDYFPLFPWLFLFFAGYFGWAPLKSRFAPKPGGKNPLALAGRHSLAVYMAHQPVIYGVCLLLARGRLL